MYDGKAVRAAIDAGGKIFLVGDSLLMVIYKHKSTRELSPDEAMEIMLWHTRMVSEGAQDKNVIEIIGDMPRGSYDTAKAALVNARRFLESGATAVKIEGGRDAAPIGKALTGAGIRWYGHIGYEPQKNELKAYGIDVVEQTRLFFDALSLQEAGAEAVVLEMIYAEVAAAITGLLKKPTIGIGSGPDTDYQILVINDILGTTDFQGKKKPCFAVSFRQEGEDPESPEVITEVFKRFQRAIESGAYPQEKNYHQLPASLARWERKRQLKELLGDLEKSASITWAEAGRVFDLAAELGLKDSVEFFKRIRLLLARKYIQGGGNVGERLSEIDKSLTKIVSDEEFPRYYNIVRAVFSALPHQGLDLSGIIKESEYLHYLVGNNSAAEDIRTKAHACLTSKVYQMVNDYALFLAGQKEFPGRFYRENDTKAKSLVERYLKSKQPDSRGRDIYTAVKLLQKYLADVYGEEGRQYVTSRLEYWSERGPVKGGNLENQFLELIRLMDSKEYLFAAVTISKIREAIYKVVTQQESSDKLELIYLDIFLEKVLGKLSGSIVSEYFKDFKENRRAVLELIKLLVENTLYSGWAGLHLYLLSRIVDTADRTYLQLKNILELILRDFTDILDQIHAVVDMPLAVYRRYNIHIEQEKQELKARFRRSIVSYDRSLYIIEEALRQIKNLPETEKDSYIFGPWAVPSGLPAVVHIDSVNEEFIAEKTAILQEQFGGKGVNMMVMNSLGLNVPSGFVIPIAVSRYKLHEKYPDEFERMVLREMKVLEDNWSEKYRRLSGENSLFRFNPAIDELREGVIPLLVSVRPGSILKMPGSLPTITNIGMNDKIAEFLARKFNPRFAYDTYSRFLESYAEVVYGIPGERFSNLLEIYTYESGSSDRSRMNDRQLKILCDRFKNLIVRELEIMGIDSGILEGDLACPLRQFNKALKAVLNSWEREDAFNYRACHGISNNFYAPVTVQAMVYGNLDAESGAGVLIYRNIEGRIIITGEYGFNAQGPDIADGLIRPGKISMLKEKSPRVYYQLLEEAGKLSARYFVDPEIEFTVSGQGQLWFLQVSREAHRKRIAWRKLAVEGYKPSGKGIGVYGGALRGKVIFDAADIKSMSEAAREEGLDGVVLVMNYPLPSDTGVITGKGLGALLSAKGGIGSHGASIARGDGIYAILGIDELTFNVITRKWYLGDAELNKGDVLSLDARAERGYVYRGLIPYAFVSSPVVDVVSLDINIADKALREEVEEIKRFVDIWKNDTYVSDDVVFPVAYQFIMSAETQKAINENGVYVFNLFRIKTTEELLELFWDMVDEGWTKVSVPYQEAYLNTILHDSSAYKDLSRASHYDAEDYIIDENIYFHLNKNDLVLDVGVGCGAHIARIVAKRVKKVYGTEISPEIIKQAERHIQEGGITNIELQLVENTRLPYADNLFDWIIVSRFFFNLMPKMRIRMLDSINRVLKSEGILNIRTYSALISELCWDVGDWEEYLEKSGFKVNQDSVRCDDEKDEILITVKKCGDRRVIAGSPLEGDLSSPLEQVSRRALRISANSRLLAVFDVHGTLLEPTWKEEYAQAYSILSEKSYIDAIAWVNSLTPETKDSQVIDMFSELSKFTREETKKLFMLLRNNIRKKIVPRVRPGILGFIEALHSRKIPIVIVSGAEHSLIEHQLNQHALLEYINPEMLIGKDDLPQVILGDKMGFRAAAIESVMAHYPGHTLLYFNDWFDGIKEVKSLDGVIFGVLNGEGREREFVREVLAAEGVDFILEGWHNWPEIFPALNISRKERKTKGYSFLEARARRKAVEDKIYANTREMVEAFEPFLKEKANSREKELKQLFPEIYGYLYQKPEETNYDISPAPLIGRRNLSLIKHIIERGMGRKLLGLERYDLALFQDEPGISRQEFKRLSRIVKFLNKQGILPYLRSAFLYHDVSKAGLKRLRRSWQEIKGIDLLIPNKASALILRNKAYPDSQKRGLLENIALFGKHPHREILNEFFYRIIETRGLAGQWIRVRLLMRFLRILPAGCAAIFIPWPRPLAVKTT